MAYLGLVLSGRFQAVNSSLYEFEYVGIGIPQGTILGPLLFIIFVNSLHICVNCRTIMYADDTTLMCSSNGASVLQSHSELNENLSKTASWFKENHLTSNIKKKTKLMVFGTRYILHKFQNISVSYNGDCIDNADKFNMFKYVGVTFDP